MSQTLVIKKLANRLENANGESERVATIRELQVLAKTEYEEIGLFALQTVLDLLNHATSAEENQEILDLIERLIKSKNSNVNIKNAKAILSENLNVATFLELMGNSDMTVSIMASQILTELHTLDGGYLEKCIQQCPNGLNKLIERIFSGNSSEEVRNQALVLIQELTLSDESVKDALVFQEGYDILFNIIKEEKSYGECSVVMLDCLKILRNVLHDSKICQQLFYAMNQSWILELADNFDVLRLEAAHKGEESELWFSIANRIACCTVSLIALAASVGVDEQLQAKYQDAIAVNLPSVVKSLAMIMSKRGPIELFLPAMALLVRLMRQNPRASASIGELLVEIDGKVSDVPTFGFSVGKDNLSTKRMIGLSSLLCELYLSVPFIQCWDAKKQNFTFDKVPLSLVDLSCCRSSSTDNIGRIPESDEICIDLYVLLGWILNRSDEDVATSVIREFIGHATDPTIDLSSICIHVLDEMITSDTSFGIMVFQHMLAPPLPMEDDMGELVPSVKPLGTVLFDALVQSSISLVQFSSKSDAQEGQLKSLQIICRILNLITMFLFRSESIAVELLGALTTAHTIIPMVADKLSSIFSNQPAASFSSPQPLIEFLFSLAAKLSSLPSSSPVVSAFFKLFGVLASKSPLVIQSVLLDPAKCAFLSDLISHSNPFNLSESAQSSVAFFLCYCLYSCRNLVVNHSAETSAAALIEKAGLSRVLKLLQAPLSSSAFSTQNISNAILGKSQDFEVVLPPWLICEGFRGFYEQSCELIRQTALVNENKDNQVIQMQSQRIAELEAELTKLKSFDDPSFSPMVSTRSGLSEVPLEDVDITLNLRLELESKDAAISEQQSLLSTQQQRIDEFQRILEEKSDEILTVKERYLSLDEQVKVLQLELAQRDRKIGLLEAEHVTNEISQLQDEIRTFRENSNQFQEEMMQSSQNFGKMIASIKSLSDFCGCEISNDVFARANNCATLHDISFCSHVFADYIQDCIDALSLVTNKGSDILDACQISVDNSPENTLSRLHYALDSLAAVCQSKSVLPSIEGGIESGDIDAYKSHIDNLQHDLNEYVAYAGQLDALCNSRQEELENEKRLREVELAELHSSYGLRIAELEKQLINSDNGTAQEYQKISSQLKLKDEELLYLQLQLRSVEEEHEQFLNEMNAQQESEKLRALQDQDILQELHRKLEAAEEDVARGAIKVKEMLALNEDMEAKVAAALNERDLACQEKEMSGAATAAQEELSNELNAMYAAFGNKSNEYEGVCKELNGLKVELESKHLAYASIAQDLEAEKCKFDEELGSLKIELIRLKNENANIVRDYNALKLDHASVSSDKSSHSAELNKLRHEHATVVENLARWQDAYNTSAVDIDNLKQELASKANESSNLKAEIERLTTQHAALNNNFDQLESVLADCRRNLTLSQNSLLETQINYEQVVKEKEELVLQFASITSDMKNLQTAYDSKCAEISDVARVLQSEDSEILTLKATVKALQDETEHQIKKHNRDLSDSLKIANDIHRKLVLASGEDATAAGNTVSGQSPSVTLQSLSGVLQNVNRLALSLSQKKEVTADTPKPVAGGMWANLAKSKPSSGSLNDTPQPAQPDPKLTAELNALKVDYLAKCDEFADLQSKFDSLVKERLNVEDELSNLKVEYNSLQVDCASRNAETISLKQQIKSISDEKQALINDLSNVKAHAKALTERCSVLEEESLILTQNNSDKKRYEEKINVLYTLLAEKSEEIKKLSLELSNTNHTLEAKKLELELLREELAEKSKPPQVIPTTPFVIREPDITNICSTDSKGSAYKTPFVSTKELLLLKNELAREKMNYTSLYGEHSELLELLAQQEVELEEFKATVEHLSLQCGLGEGLYEVSERARKRVENTYGSYIEFRV